METQINLSQPTPGNLPADQQIQDLLAQRDFLKAEELIRQKLRNDPQNPDGHYLLGVMYYFKGQVPQTVENLRKALSLDPRHTDAAICLSVLYNDIGKYEDAKKVFEQANQSVAFKSGADNLRVDKQFAVKHLELADL